MTPAAHKSLTEYLVSIKGRGATMDFDGFDFIAGAVKAMIDVTLDRGLAALDAEFFPRRDPRPGDVVLMSDGALGIWQGTTAYVLTTGGWGPAIGTGRPSRVWAVF